MPIRVCSASVNADSAQNNADQAGFRANQRQSTPIPRQVTSIPRRSPAGHCQSTPIPRQPRANQRGSRADSHRCLPNQRRFSAGQRRSVSTPRWSTLMLRKPKLIQAESAIVQAARADADPATRPSAAATPWLEVFRPSTVPEAIRARACIRLIAMRGQLATLNGNSLVASACGPGTLPFAAARSVALPSSQRSVLSLQLGSQLDRLSSLCVPCASSAALHPFSPCSKN